jgi:hypothetical protein
VNRVTAAGLLAEMRAGKRVAVVTTWQEARPCLHAIYSAGLQDGETARWSHGQEQVSNPGGGRIVILTPLRLRGISADLVYLDTAVSPEIESDAYLIVMATKAGQVVYR